MAINTLSLPVDIPWKRLCVSEDMIDRKVCDREFPFRWRSSVTVFSYQPPDDQQTYEGQIVTYLKVACTITGYQPDPEEVGIRDRRVDSYWNDPEVIESYKEAVSAYYGCYGAILEVAVAPAGSQEEVERIPLSHYPYFADFEPKKREVYEIVSETGEMMSRSLEDVNVRKGTTTSNSHEVVDIFGGFSQSVNTPWGGGSHEITGQWGSRDLNQEQYENIRTTDHAREMRETFSHTTQLTQMYHQFTSYHLGTNRAVFFMLPRPHIVENENAFVNGPRLLEGIQEIFLVVMRPKDIQGICVEAYLETAHIFNEPQYEYRQRTKELSLHVETNLYEANEDYHVWAETSATCEPDEGWEIDLDRSNGYDVASVSCNRDNERYYSYSVVAERDHVTVTGRVRGDFEYHTFEDDYFDGTLDVVLTVFQRQKEPEVRGYLANLYLTGRGVCCCELLQERPKFEIPVGVVWEAPLVSPTDYLIGGSARVPIKQANQVRTEIGKQLIHSINHPQRYAVGKVRFTDTQFIARSIVRLMRTRGHPDNQPVGEIRGLDQLIRDKVAHVAPRISRSKLLEMSLAEQVDRFGLSDDQARQLRRALLGLEGPLPDPQHRWDPPGRRTTEQTVPDMVGRSLENARKLLQAAKLRMGDTTYQDDEKPRDTVLNQYPNAGTKVQSGSDIDLVVASGAIVQIPDVVGKPLSQAILMLHQAGLESEPEIMFAPSTEQPSSRVLEVTPEMRSYVTPHAGVILQVSSGPGKGAS